MNIKELQQRQNQLETMKEQIKLLKRELVNSHIHSVFLNCEHIEGEIDCINLEIAKEIKDKLYAKFKNNQN